MAENSPMRQIHSAGWEQRHADKDKPSNLRSPTCPAEKSAEEDQPYNRRNREIG
jgi:hypothetical protein